jgi:hypothetical protein
VRQDAIEMAGLERASGRIVEVKALAILAGAAAAALRNNDVAQAVAACDAQARLLEHAGACLQHMVQQIASTPDQSSAYHMRLGHLLCWVLRQDMAWMEVTPRRAT